jgi:ribosomal protein S25
MSCLHNEEVKESIQNEVAEMSVNDFSNLVEKHDLGIDVVDDIFYKLVQKIFEERAV